MSDKSVADKLQRSTRPQSTGYISRPVSFDFVSHSGYRHSPKIDAQKPIEAKPPEISVPEIYQTRLPYDFKSLWQESKQLLPWLKNLPRNSHTAILNFRNSWQEGIKRAGIGATAFVFAISVMIVAWPGSSRALNQNFGASGKGLLAYSDSTTTPQKRQWNYGNSSFGAEAATTTWDDTYQTVIKASPVVKDFWVIGVADNAGNLDVRHSTDGGATWTSGFTATIGGTGTTRRFDIGFEQQSGEAIVMYSKNATTNELGIRRFTSSWQTEVTFDPSGTADVITWIELAERANSDELAVSYSTNTTANNINAGIWFGEDNNFTTWTTANDTTESTIHSFVSDDANGVLYAGTGTSGLILRCIKTTGCDASGDWTTGYDAPVSGIRSLAYDSANGVIYAGTGNSGVIYRCATSSGCDSGATDWTTAYGTPDVIIYSMFYDSANSIMYAGSSSGIIYRCATSSGCDSGATDWAVAYSTGTTNIRGFTRDSANGVIYAGTGNTGIIYRCATSSGCDSGATDWTIAYDTTETNIHSLVYDSAKSVLYAGSDLNGIIYRCATSSGCDSGATDWTTAYDTTETKIASLTYDSANGVLYAGSDSSGIIYRCATGSDCDSGSTDWTTALDTVESSVDSLTYDSANGVLYAGSSGTIYRCDTGTGCVSTSTFNTAAFGACDPTTAVGDTKCFDINYETASGRPVLIWGISAAGNSTNQVRATRWNGATWTTTSIDLTDDATQLDCAADPSLGSLEMACVSMGNGSDDSQAWAMTYVETGGSGCGTGITNYTCIIDPSIDTAAHVDAAGRTFVAVMYLVNGGARRAVAVFADAADDGVFDASVFNGSTWTTDQTLTQTAAAANEENILAVTNPYNNSEGLLIFSDTGSDLWASKVTFNGTEATVTVTAADGGAALETSLTNIDGAAFDMAFEPQSPATALTQDGYIWENDDGSAADGNSQQAGGNTAITGVRKGERLTLRMQMKNTGVGYSDEDWSLFYDQGDGIWSKVKSSSSVAAAASGGCGANGANSSYTCSIIDNDTDSTGLYSSLAIDPSGTPWVSYKDSTATSLMVAKYVGSGGSGCGASASGAWNCTTVDNDTDNTGAYSSIAIDSKGVAWISYQDSTNNDLMVAKFVGSGGTGCGASGSTAWSCSAVDGGGGSFDGYFNNIAIDSQGTPWIAYYEDFVYSPVVAHYVGAGGTGCEVSTAWSCITIEQGTNNRDGQYVAIGFDHQDTPWISYYRFQGTQSLRVAKYVGYGGTGCGDIGDNSSPQWTCTTVYANGDPAGLFTSITVDSAGAPWVSFYKDTADGTCSSTGECMLLAAHYVGSGGSGCGTGGSSAWSCTIVDDDTDDTGGYTSIAMDPNNTPWITYYDWTAGSMNLARYVGSGGSGCGSAGSSAWLCTVIDDDSGDNTGEDTSLAFDANGTPWIAYRDVTATSTMVAKLSRGGEILLSPSTAGSDNAALTESHADMTGVTDTTGRDNANCRTGAASWNNGAYVEAEHASALIKSGLATAQCTEVSFTIDTSQAVAGNTYRFIIASNDSFEADRTVWRGPIAVTSGAYATLTMDGDQGPLVRYSKDNMAKFADCSNIDWGCTTVDDPTNTVGSYTSFAFDSGGNAWVSYRDFQGQTLNVARYVGSGGSGCTNTAWTCTVIDDPANDVGGYTNINLDQAGNAWISYLDFTANALKVARYVGSGGSGCTNTAWTCTTVDDPSNTIGDYISMALDPAGNAWVSYRDFTAGALKVARYVGSGGSGCNDVAWTCTTVDDPANLVGVYTSIAFDPGGNAWISYLNDSVKTLKVARYVGSGGSGCNDAAWTCTTVDDPANSVGLYTSIAFDPAGNAWVSYRDLTALSLKVARYVGSNGSGCSDAAWTCTTVDDPANDVGQYNSIAFDSSGVPWISHRNTTTSTLIVSKLHMPLNKPSATITNTPGRGNARWGDLRYRLARGLSPRTNANGICTNAVADMMGYCGVYADDGNYDSITGTNERVAYTLSRRVTSNQEVPTVAWKGLTNIAPTSSSIQLQVYRFGTTNAWETVASNTTSADCSTVNCSVSGMPTGTASEYFEADGSNYWIYFRVWQYESASSLTFKTDYFDAISLKEQMRHGTSFESGAKRPFNW
jgi:hypothetical protein